MGDLDLWRSVLGDLYPVIVTVLVIGLVTDLALNVFIGRAVWVRRKAKIAAVEENERLKDALATLWLYSDWYYCTKSMTTEQRELWADVIDAHHRERYPDSTPVERWWRSDARPNRGPRRPA